MNIRTQPQRHILQALKAWAKRRTHAGMVAKWVSLGLRRNASSHTRGLRFLIYAPRLLVLAYGLLAAPVWAQLLYTRTYGTEQGLPGAQVFGGLQDSRGYLWFGTSSGLVRYNGSEFVAFGADTGLPQQSMRALIEFQGDIYVTSESGVCRYHDEMFSCYGSDQGVGAGVVWKVVEFGGTLWFGTNEGGLSILKDGGFARLTQTDGLPSNSITELFADGDSLWIGTRDAGLARYRNGSIEIFGEQQGLQGKDVRAITRWHDELYVGTRDSGIARWDGKRFVLERADEAVYCVSQWQGDLLWGTLGKGVLRFSQDGSERLDSARSGLAGDRVYSMLVDRENLLWVLTNKGMSKIASDAFRSYRPGDNILAITSHADSMWFGTLGKGLLRKHGDNWQQYGTEVLLDNVVWSLASQHGTLWIGTNSGLNSFDGERFAAFTTQQGLPSNTVLGLYADNENLWIATLGGLSRFNGEQFKNFSTTDGLGSNHVRSVTRVGDEIYAALEGGVAAIRGDEVRMLGLEQSLSSSGAYAITRGVDGELWVGTNSGLNHWRNGRFEHLRKADGLRDDFVASLAVLGNTLWVGTNAGLNSVVDGRVQRSLDHHHGLLGSEFNANSIFVEQPNALWLGTANGVTRYDVARDVVSSSPPPTLIESVHVDGNKVPLSQQLALKYGHSSISFSYAGLSFAQEEDVRFRSRLVGFDKHWSEASSARQIRYTNLSGGNYIFEVHARNGAGQWSEPARFSFRVLPPFWLTWWFIVFVVLLTLLLIYCTVRLRLRQIRLRNVELEELVALRTRELEHANVELTELSLTDPLTQLGNRRLLMETMPQEVKTVQRRYEDLRRGRPVSPDNRDLGVLIIDIDYFKRVNDQFGHHAGDQLLTQFAERLSTCVRDQDLLVRWGGEEFVIVARHMDRNHLHDFAQRVAKSIRGQAFLLPQQQSLIVTCCIGHAAYPFNIDQTELFSLEEVIGLADKGLYLAKQNGRDLVVGLEAGVLPIATEQHVQIKTEVAKAIKDGHVRVVCERDDLKV